jgi:hypothetical protein
MVETEIMLAKIPPMDLVILVTPIILLMLVLVEEDGVRLVEGLRCIPQLTKTLVEKL